MKKIALILLTLISVTTVAQRIKKKDIEFSSMEEVEQAVDYLNKCRTIPGYAEDEVGVTLHPKIVKTSLSLDKKLQKIAEKRVIEMINNNTLSHRTNVKDIRGLGSAECIAYNFDGNLITTIHQYIIDKGVKGLGHRKTLLYRPWKKHIGYAGGWYDGKFWTCVLLS
jgi:hypothetical protein